MAKLKLPDFIFMFLLLVAYLSYRAYLPPSPSSNNSDLDFEQAKNHLSKIAAFPHPIGTKEHSDVKNYIVEQINLLGYPNSTQKNLVASKFVNRTKLVDIENIIALKSGTDSDGMIVLAAHYDSQPNTPGAADDGAAVASMLAVMENIRNLQHKNDILFLFTDGEEMGLNGAKSFVENYPRKDQIKYLFNFEARGNAGSVLAFETTEKNAGIIKDLSKLNHIYANSLMYEVYKILPNDSDFTYFKKLNISGVNFAMIDGFVNYHSMTDTPENINENSFFHHAIIMDQLVDLYKDKNLNTEADHDLSYFNIIGARLIYYKAFWNLILLVISIFLLAFVMRQDPELKGIRLKDVLSSSLLFFGLIVGLIFIVVLLAQAILGNYPHYKNFYSSNYYNSNVYLIAFLSLTAFLFYQFVLFYRKNSKLQLAMLHYWAIILLLILSVVSYWLIQTGAHLFIVPTFLFLLISCLVIMLKSKTNQLLSDLTPAIKPIFFLILWSPLIYLFYVAFSLSNPYVSVFLGIMLLFILIPLLSKMAMAWRWIFLGIFAMAMIRAHSLSVVTKSQPYQIQFHQHTNLNTGENVMISNDSRLDFVEKTIFTKPEIRNLYPDSDKETLLSKTSISTDQNMQIEYTIDTLENGKGRYTIDIRTQRDIIQLKLKLLGITHVKEVIFGRKPLTIPRMRDDQYEIDYLGKIGQNPLQFSFTKGLEKDLKVRISTFERGLLDKLNLGPEIIPGPTNKGGTIVQSKDFDF